MPIKFGLLTNPVNNILEEIKSIQKLGFDYVEIGIEIPEGTPEVLIKNRNEILKLVNKFSSPPIAHTAWWIDFGSLYEPVREGWIEEARRSIDVAKSLNMSKINFHFYSIGLTKIYKPYHNAVLVNIISSLKEIVNYASSKKMTVILENAPIKKSVIGLKEYKLVVDNVPRLKVHFDIGHAFVENGLQGIKDYILTFKNKIEHIHVSDNHGDEDDHLPLGKGKINFKQVAKWLKQINYDKTITFEVFTNKKDAKESMLRFKKMIN